MMLLVDSNVIIDFWRNPSDEVRKIFESNDVYTCGVVVAELLHGATSEKNLNNIKKTMASFPMLNMEKSDWEKLGDILYKLRTNGLRVPFQDVVITCLAVKHNVAVWTNDKHFKLIKGVITDLKLHE